jgi:hypothetical protein
MSNGNGTFSLHGLRGLLEVAPTAAAIRHQIEALELAIVQGSAQAFDMADGLLNSICKTIMADRGHVCDSTWTTVQLFRETITKLQLFPPGHPDPAKATEDLKDTVRGLVSTVQGLYNLRRNHGVIAHGRDGYTVALETAQIELAARTADAVATFLLSVHRQYARVQPVSRPRYEEQPDFNEQFDKAYPVVIWDVNLSASEVLFTFDPVAYQDALVNFVPEPEEGGDYDRELPP